MRVFFQGLWAQVHDLIPVICRSKVIIVTCDVKCFFHHQPATFPDMSSVAVLKGYFANFYWKKQCVLKTYREKNTAPLHATALCPTFILFLSQEALIQCWTSHSVPQLFKGWVSCYCWTHFGCSHSPCGSARIVGGIKRHKWGKETAEHVIGDEVSRRWQADFVIFV